MDEKLKYKIRSAVEKLGLKQSLEMFGEDIIRQAYIDNPLSFLNQFNNLTPVGDYDLIFYVDNEGLPLFYHMKNLESKHNKCWITYTRIWSFFSEIMGYNQLDVQEIMEKWLESTYNLSGITPEPNI
jgi:hypothetical protein